MSPAPRDRLGQTLNALGAVAFVASFAARSESAWWIVPVALLPVLVLTLAIAIRPRLRLETRGLDGLMLCLTLCSVSLTGFALYAPVVSATPAWWSAVVSASVFVVCGARIDGPSPRLARAFLGCVGAAYGYGASIVANQLLDTTPPRHFEAEVTDAWIRSEPRGGAKPELQVALPQGEENAMVLEVSQAVYSHCSKGNRVPLDVHEGALAMRWVTVAGDCHGNEAPNVTRN